MFKVVRNIAFVVVLIYVWYVLCENQDDDSEGEKNVKEEKSGEIFVPTHEWKQVKKGQPIPPGLHVRMNLETGITEAKLLDDKGNSKGSSIQAVSEVVDHKPENVIQNSKLFKPSQLKDAMKNIKGDDIINPDELKQMTKKFRKYEDLKKDLESVNLTPKTDVELLTDILNELKEPRHKKQFHMLKLLEDLDFLVHQIDNAIEFSRQNGFKEIIYKNLNSSDVRIKSESLKLFSSLVQNNPKVKVDAIETGGLNILLKIITLDPSQDIKARGVTALSCLLRRFPYAQLKFVENGGFNMISELFASSNVKTKLKFVTLISDLLIERQDMNDDTLDKQYKLLNLNNLLLEHNWCEKLNDLLEIVIVTDTEGHESVEKCLLAIKSLGKDCGSKFNRNIFVKLQRHYHELAVRDLAKDEEISNTDFFNEISDICKEILTYIPDMSNKKTEL